MQELAHNAIAEVLDEPGDPASAIVTIDPHNGYIETMAESESYEQSQYNLAAEGHRQPGSTFKAIDLADALSRGRGPEQHLLPLAHAEPGWLASYPKYEVHTFEGTSLNKSINLVQATLTSDNTVYAQLAADLGESTITEMAYKMGVKTHLNSYPAEAIGGLTLGVTPLEMSVVYATLADGGWRNTPIAITKVVFPDGHVDSSWGKPHRVKVLSNGVTAEETSILHENVLSGTAVRSAIDCPTAAKTGTTSELVDAWLDGYTPEYSTVVWMGYPNKRVPMTDVHGEPQQGGPAGRDLARLHVRRRRHALRRIPAADRTDRLSAVLREIRHHRARRLRRARRNRDGPAIEQPGHGKAKRGQPTPAPRRPARRTGGRRRPGAGDRRRHAGDRPIRAPARPPEPAADGQRRAARTRRHRQRRALRTGRRRQRRTGTGGARTKAAAEPGGGGAKTGGAPPG